MQTFNQPLILVMKFDLEVVLLHLNQSTGVDPRHERDRETYVNNNPNCLTYSCLVLVMFTCISRCPTCLLYFLQSIQTTYRLFTSVRCVCVRASVYFASFVCVDFGGKPQENGSTGPLWAGNPLRRSDRSLSQSRHVPSPRNAAHTHMGRTVGLPPKSNDVKRERGG